MFSKQRIFMSQSNHSSFTAVHRRSRGTRRTRQHSSAAAAVQTQQVTVTEASKLQHGDCPDIIPLERRTVPLLLFAMTFSAHSSLPGWQGSLADRERFGSSPDWPQCRTRPCFCPVNAPPNLIPCSACLLPCTVHCCRSSGGNRPKSPKVTATQSA